MNYIKTFEQYVFIPINELVARSKLLDDVYKFLDKFNLPEYSIYENDGILNIELCLSARHKYLEIIKGLENYYGWVLIALMNSFTGERDNNVKNIKSTLFEGLEDMVNEIGEEYIEDSDETDLTLLFEATHHNEVNPNLLPDTIYHITDQKHFDKIQKQGLVPKAKNKLTAHPERIYFLLKYSSAQELLSHPQFSVGSPVIISIDTTSFRNKIQFYNDPNMNGAIYCSTNIPPSTFTSVTPFYE